MEDLSSRKKAAESENKKMFRSRFDIFVLNALEDKDGASYGYDVINYIQSKTKGHYKIKTFSTIYNTLKRLEEQHFVVSGKGDGETNGATRVYYTLTPEGREYLNENKEEYKYLRTLLDNLLTDEDFDLENEEAPYKASDLKPLTKRTRTDLSVGESSEADESVAIEAAAVVNDLSDFSEFDDIPVADSIQVFDKVTQNTDSRPTNTVYSVKPARKSNYNTEYKTIIEKITAPVLQEKTKKKQVKPSTSVTKQTPLSAAKNGKEIMDKPPQVSSNTNTISAAINQANQEKDDSMSNVERFRVGVRSEGYSFNTFKPKTQQNTKYIYFNKLLRDSVVLSALYFIVCILVLFILRRTFEFSLTALLVCGGFALAAALVATMIWFKTPEKRKKDVINLRIINLVTIGFFTVFFMLDLIISLLIPNGKGLDVASIYSPVIIASTSLFFGLIFSVLYKSENYSVK